MTDLTDEEIAFIDRVKPRLENNLSLLKKKGVEPGAGSYVLSEDSNIYHGVPFSAARTIHGEENAIGTMLTEESVKATFRMLLVVGDPQEMIVPCGMCRVAIRRYGVEDASVLCSNLKKGGGFFCMGAPNPGIEAFIKRAIVHNEDEWEEYWQEVKKHPNAALARSRLC